jgi:hypothetical protein
VARSARPQNLEPSHAVKIVRQLLTFVKRNQDSTSFNFCRFVLTSFTVVSREASGGTDKELAFDLKHIKGGLPQAATKPNNCIKYAHEVAEESRRRAKLLAAQITGFRPTGLMVRW